MGGPRQEHGAAMKWSAATVAVALMLAACSTTPTELEQKAEQLYPDNYQEIYRRVSTTAKRCMATNLTGYASMAVDSELYSELGYGEISVSLINVGVRNYYVSARIEKQPKGSRMVLRVQNTLPGRQYAEMFQRWATGDQNC